MTAGFFGGLAGFHVLHVRRLWSGYEYMPRRHAGMEGAWVGLLDAGVAVAAGAIILARLGWLLGRRRRLSRIDLLLLIPVAVVAYLGFVANFG